MKGTNQTTRLTDEQRRLVERHLGVVGMIVNRYTPNGTSDRDDLFQIGCQGLMKAAMSHDPERGKFTTYAAQCVRNELRMARRRAYTKRRGRGIQPLSLDAPLAVDSDPEGDCLKDRLPGANPDILNRMIERETCQAALALVCAMPRRDQEILRGHLGGARQLQLAAQHGISQSYVCRIIQRTLNCMREGMEQCGVCP